MRKVVALLCIVVLPAVGWIGWKFQPWMPAGRAVHVSSERVGNCDVQVWQRKTKLVSEPFATGLFVRKDGSRWRVFLLGVEDTYRTRISLRGRGSLIEVFRDNDRLGVFDGAQETFKWDSDGTVLSGDLLDSEPAGDWWLKRDGGVNQPRQ